MDKYVRIKKIGEGAFGRAVLVKNKHDANQYVVKEINIIKMSPKEREDARKEVAVLAQLKHPNIVAYRDSFEESGSLYIVMDYCSGGDLYGRINAQKGQLFSEDQILDWFVQMCLAIKHIHDRKILHRDIKSQNIFLTSQETVKLGDFGIAKVLGSTVELARTCIGTPYYLSPEICENKPYNNKSDVWSLGCVLYELTTLKHAFEAGNMKNLVLKIIRGSYPPVPSKYSYELRGLIALLFKRAPRERPSINSILKKPFVSQKVPKFLSNEQLADEFSHTVMHGKKLARKLPPPPQPAASRPSSAAGQRPSSARKYDPAKVYGAPLSKSKENRGSTPDLRKRPGSAGGGPQAKRSPSNSSLNKKKQQFIEKEKKRREEELKKEYEKRHKELMEKQKVARINKSREENWKGIVDSLGSDESEKERKQEVKNDQGEQVRWQPPKPQVQQPPAPFYNHDPDKRPVSDDKGRYEHYHAYLDKLQERKKQEGGPPPQVPPAAYMAAPRPLPQAPQPNPVWRQAPRVPDATPLAIKQAEKDRFLGQQAAERARIVEEFVQRKKEAAQNKQRGHAALHGTPAQHSPVQNRGPDSAAGQQRPPSGISNRNRDEHEYLEKLRQIRMQNFNERKNIQGQLKEELDSEARRKKAEALRKQSEDWAEQRKNALEQKRKELMEKERAMRENREKDVKPEQRPLPKPAPGLPITGVMNAIGVKPKVVQDVPPANR
ncbi:hypothetical protein CHS0354_012567 [Potamilus streckersoni]|uniref:non-specific serine/threonine protein kinase n=1 Tax=Potamilus streckersoni TaxID=2493646 RepID=A0AAE0W4H0_9BIVA|nr:hypothetical protein CHS0354_012567 [Potamilus streckersoni]